MNVNKCTRAGGTFIFWVADWFALMNDKMGGDLHKIKVRYQTLNQYRERDHAYAFMHVRREEGCACMHACTEGGVMDRWTDGGMGGWMDGWMGRGMNGWRMDG